MATDLNIVVKTSGITNDLSIRFPLGDTITFIEYALLEYLTELGEVSTDITDATFMIKADPTDLDADALYSKVLSDAEITNVTASNVVRVTISDFTGLDITSKYYAALGIKFSGDAIFREVPAIKKFIQFDQDIIRA